MDPKKQKISTKQRNDWLWKQDNNPTGRWIKAVYSLLRNDIEEMLRPLEISHSQWRALGALDQFHGLTHTDLEAILEIERPSVTSLITGMEKRGWVVRHEHPDDARYKQIFLTEHGLKLAEQTSHFSQVVDKRLLAVLKKEEVETLRSLLQKIVRDYKRKER